ncbi:hypothetical protein EVA_06988 [gut metagenome]|uniref:Uncharacterized protein n=1 Tax=gut metagenome TaxID=749906 RepID=J9GDF2_9ZZZZ
MILLISVRLPAIFSSILLLRCKDTDLWWVVMLRKTLMFSLLIS